MESLLKEENVTYTGDGITMHGFIAYDGWKEDKRAAVLVVHEWWGLNDYTKTRARQLAELGYIAMAIDLYGDGRQADNPKLAGELSAPLDNDPQKAKARFEAALAKIKTYSQTDPDNIAAIGYCFGGGQVLNMAKLGCDLKGVVSFHGSLPGVPPQKGLLKAAILVCHGADDQFVQQPAVDKFKQQLDAIGANYTFKVYEGAKHAFTNPAATARGEKFNIPIAYNEEADKASWSDMKAFFDQVFN